MRKLSSVLVLSALACAALTRAEEKTAETSAPAASSYMENRAGLNMNMIWIEGGAFRMGSPESEVGRDKDEGPTHTVTLPGFWMGATEVAQAQYEALMGNNPSFNKGENHPVECVSWENAMEFCRKLSDAAGTTYTLPSEAQWEYACRAGSSSRFCFGDSDRQLGDYAWHGENAGKQTHPVGKKKPNAWGLYDMHGNVWEWCLDLGGPYESDSTHGAKGASKGGSEAVSKHGGGGGSEGGSKGSSAWTCHLMRGGSWLNDPRKCRSAYRVGLSPDTSVGVGFRVARPGVLR